MNEFKIVSIGDVGGKVRIPGRGLVRTPVSRILLTSDQVWQLKNMHAGPKHIFYVDPANPNRKIPVTNENINATNAELFGTVTTAAEETIETVAVDTSSQTLDDVDAPEVVEEIKLIETTTEVETDTTDTETDSNTEVVKEEVVETTVVNNNTSDIDDDKTDDIVNDQISDADDMIDVESEPVTTDEKPVYSGNKQYSYKNKNRR